MAIVVQLPEGEARFVAVDLEFFARPLGEVAGRVRRTIEQVMRSSSDQVDEKQMEMEELSSAFPDFRLDEDEEDEDDENGEDDEAVDCRILFQGRDLELEPFGVRIESGREGIQGIGSRQALHCTIGFPTAGRLLGAKEVLAQCFDRKKEVEHIKEWLEKKKREDELVNLLTGEGPELPKPTSETDSVDPEYLRKLKRSAASRPGLVSQGPSKRSSSKHSVRTVFVQLFPSHIVFTFIQV
ncbi:unnamed protein product [Cladocopium goreaui]|uniref:Sde2 N-terminal ubiquitin domain-containing protein n=1 Tax=Cladocopium goreaui TaxID=2562237 RepID=A0A9P1CML8_9DINO|nr:unnamed protein product [Cladocopium goreaui]